MTFLFEKLSVYQKAQNFADNVSTLTMKFPKSYWYTTDQFNRASLSIALNIAEGNGRGTMMDKRRFMHFARGSVFECVSLLDMCGRKKLFSQEINAELRSTLVELSKMLSTLIEKMNATGTVREETVDYV